MGKDKQNEVNPEVETEVKPVEETPQGVTVGMGVYKPVPRFSNGCKNC